MDRINSKKLVDFITKWKDTVYCRLSNRIRSFKSLPEADREDIYHKSAYVLYEKIDKDVLTRLVVKIQSDEAESETEFPVFVKESEKTLLSYFVEICYRQTLKFIGRKKNCHISEETKRKEKIRELAKDYGMSVDDVTDMLAGYALNGLVDSGYIKEIEIDGFESDGPWEEILKECEESDNSMYQEIVSQAMDTLAERCKELLGSYYAQKTRWADIAIILGIKGGADSAKVAASRCRKTLFKKCHEIERKYNG